MRLVLDARTASFAALIDYAGLFPPATLDMVDAVAGYRAARASKASWVAGRFLCPSSRLEELAGVLTTTFTAGEEPWEIGVIVDTAVGAGAAASQTFHAEMQPAATVASVEARIGDTDKDSIKALVNALISIQPEVVPYLEVLQPGSLDGQVRAVAHALADIGHIGGVKIRCGGTDASLFPTPETVAEFILLATNARLPYKATAGLHQPIRHYDADLGVWRHGFVNLLVAAAAADAGHPLETLTDILADADPAAFNVSTAFVVWRGLSIPGPAIRRVRTHGFVAYGSCDFFEPVDALIGLSFLGDST